MPRIYNIPISLKGLRNSPSDRGSHLSHARRSRIDKDPAAVRFGCFVRNKTLFVPLSFSKGFPDGA